ncbi:cation-translocating P-type ATPase [Sediminivirga luteola]|uniref:Carbonate dehydratase n=1 Tax=Sediminivirga luteola TaxID=1774748 RepID=A0A8J2TY51_9MICO|nr:HAD-IC family P-type ATPase [Sediminivirga luteola]GGA15169.1 carbonate dehydratase [Sediminivirga luteola]
MEGTPQQQATPDHDDAVPWAWQPGEVLAALGSDAGGLAGDTAAARLSQHGPNRLPPPERDPLWRRILVHFDDVLIYILLVAAALKAVLAEWVDFTVILLVALVNGAIGFIQEGRAEKALEGIRDLLSARAEVRRDGAWTVVDADQLVPGDVIRVRAGDRVPADARLLESSELRVEESALTGESVAATKHTRPVGADAALGDRSSMVFSGTLVASGQAIAVVTATGSRTQIGRIQTMIAEVEGLQTPLTRQLARFGKTIAIAIAVMALVMAVIGRAVHDFDLPDLISAAIGFSVAAVPEGLPALVTITLALGVQQMARRRAITRKLPAVETLGSVSTICSDKTGTLTKNEMTVRAVHTATGAFEVTGTGYAPEGDLVPATASVAGHGAPDGGPKQDAALDAVTTVMMLCNDARIVQAEGTGRWRLVGEPTEGALRSLGMKAGVEPAGWRRLAVLPFSSETKYMATLDERLNQESAGTGHDAPAGTRFIHLKGAPDRVLERCSAQTGPDGRPVPLDHAFWEARIEELSARGLRVLAAARTPVASASATAGEAATIGHADVQEGLELCGVVGIVDPPRPEAIDAIAQCRRAGVRVKMITGDHAGTAAAIAREMGILDAARQRPAPAPSGRGMAPSGHGTAEAPAVAPEVITGAELEEMSTEALRAMVREVDVFARTSPEHKIRIVSALQSHGEVVAMTGDGVNDAPALTQADVGVAMGIKGTEATKEAAEIVLADDNFATIERAVEEGRRIYDNIRKSVLFLLPTNGAQSLVILVAVLLGLQLPLEPVQVLWINMVTAVTLSLALAYEPAEPDVMNRPPRDPRAGLLTGSYIRRIAIVSLLIGGATLGAFYGLLARGVPLDRAETTAVTLLAFAQLAYLFNCRRLDQSSLSPAMFRGNRAVWVSAAALLVLQSIFVYAPFMHLWFGSAPIGAAEWGVVLVLSVVVFLLTELGKWVDRRWLLARGI